MFDVYIFIVSQHSFIANQASVILHQLVCQTQNRTNVEVFCHNYKAIVIFCATTVAKPEVAIRN